MNQLCLHQFYKRQYLRRQWLGRTNPLAINSHLSGGGGSVLVQIPPSLYAILATTLGIPAITVGRKEANFEMTWQLPSLLLTNSQSQSGRFRRSS